MIHNFSTNEKSTEDTSSSSPLPIHNTSANDHGREALPVSAIDNVSPEATVQISVTRPSVLQQNLFLVFITLTQLVQMIPLGAGINSSLAIGEALGATRNESVWIVASYPLTQGTFVLIGMFLLPPLLHRRLEEHGADSCSIRRPSRRHLWPKGHFLGRLCMVGFMGFMRRILYQFVLDVFHERSMWYWGGSNNSEYRRVNQHHVSTRKEAKSWSGSLWGNGSCWCSWWFSHLRNHCAIIPVEMAVLYAVRVQGS